MQIKWLAEALANLTDEADYIAKDSPASAKDSPASAKAFFMHVLAST
jgi:plasmid stabilization system protein ParE